MLKCSIQCQELTKQDTEWHETCKCKCRLDASACNNKQRWNDDKCRCECKELIDKGVCDKLIKYWSSKNSRNNFNRVALSWAWKCVYLFSNNLCCLGCNDLSNQHWNWCLFYLFSLILEKRCYLYKVWHTYSMELRSNL